uniref:hypothetical protein n=1 Tax=Clostridium sp. NkU-1 TaxID=1095009 RepID=UPI000A5B9BB8
MLFGKGTQRKNIPEELKNIFQSDLEDTLRIDAKKISAAGSEIIPFRTFKSSP